MAKTYKQTTNPGTSEKEAIILMCFQCNGYDAEAVKECTSSDCPLHAHREKSISNITAVAKRFYTKDGDIRVERLTTRRVVCTKAARAKKPSAETEPPVQVTSPGHKKRGRPKGSKNKPLQEATQNDQSSAPRRKVVRDGGQHAPAPDPRPARKGVGHADHDELKRSRR